MRYKALMLDVDGTIIPYDFYGSPSKNVIKTIKKAQDKVTVCLVTGRAYSSAKKILEKLDIDSGYAVLNNGAHVLDISTREILYEQNIQKEDAHEIINILTYENITFFVKDDVFGDEFYKRPYQKGQKVKDVSMIFTLEEYSSEKLEKVFKKLSHLSHLTLYKVHHKSPNLFGLNITHAQATKLHGVEIILKKLIVSKEEVIGVGDGYNDFPLLMASGLKVAMGNAVSDLKAIADYIAPTVNQDGVAHVIEKFILNKKTP